MLYSHSELLKKYKSTYQIRKAIQNEKIYKLSKGIYSENPSVNYLSVIQKKYPNAIISSFSAFYYHNLTDIIPEKVYLATSRRNAMIKSDDIRQIREKEETFNVGKTKIEYEGVIINIYDKERMLIELAKSKSKIRYDMYKEIILNYRKIANSLDIEKIEKYLKYFSNWQKIFKIIQDEVF